MNASSAAPSDLPFTERLRPPFDGAALLRHAKRLKREGLAQPGLAPVRIAILGGWTTQETASLLEIFLLSLGLQAEIYQSEYNKFYEDAVLDSAALEAFKPQLVYVHTGTVNIRSYPDISANKEGFERCLEAEIARFTSVWTAVQAKLGCAVIQNNFELPLDPLGNYGAIAYAGRRHFVQRLNIALAERAREGKGIVIHDVQELAARLGSERWSDPQRWYAYKLCVTPDGNAMLAYSVARIVAASLGRTKKCLVLDLDNTLWGGVIGDDGADKIRIGRETPEAEAYTAFQEYCGELQKRGVLLAVCSKNEDAIARQGFAHPDSVLKIQSFSAFRANWSPKSENIVEIAKELNIGLDSLVFVDDNPAERAIVRAQLPMVSVPEVGVDVSRYAEILSAGGYFETVGLSKEDLARVQLYEANAERSQMEAKYASYSDYLIDLKMEAEIAPFSPRYLDRIAQLINKTNQFNLTTKRYTLAEVEAQSRDSRFVTLYGRLADRFGDNGLISIVIGRKELDALHVDLWLMSCRVLKRDMELAMLDALVAAARAQGASRIHGTYLRTEKNAMVADHYEKLGFACVERAADGSRSEWILDLSTGYEQRNHYIAVTGAAE